MMKKIKLLPVVAVLILAIVLPSCSMLTAEHGSFSGGEILDDELLSEIRSRVYGTEAVETSGNAVNTETSGAGKENAESKLSFTDETSVIGEQTSERSDTETSPDGRETSVSSPSIDESKIETVSETAPPSEETVYWTENGEVWHTKKDCRYLKNKTVSSGTVRNAEEAGKERLCSACAK